MNSEQDFINTLKDCWAGRMYRGGIHNKTLIHITHDHDSYFCYEIMDEASGKWGGSSGSFRKDDIKAYLEKYKYVRVK